MAIKIIHVEGGLGNQMACYAVYVAAKASNPQDEFYIDTYLYDVKEAHGTISMWNGYELKKVFGIEIQDIRSLFSEDEVKEQLAFLRKSEFWKHDWNYGEVFIEMMKKYGLDLQNAYSPLYIENKSIAQKVSGKFKSVITESTENVFIYKLKRMLYMAYNMVSGDCGKYLFEKREGNYFYDITLDFMKSKFLYNTIGEQVRDGLTFIEPLSKENEKLIESVKKCQSISIHVRRTDYLKFNSDCYVFGYFQRCTDYIRLHVEHPIFYVFSDDLDWCTQNRIAIGLTENDEVHFVSNNRGSNSYNDMRIMANCKHNIATKSSFGWWGGFLNRNPEKITCCQIGSYICTNQF